MSLPSAFRFLVLCEHASQRQVDSYVTLKGVVSELVRVPGESIDLQAVVGVVLVPEIAGNHLDLLLWQLDKTGKPQPVPGYAGQHLELPDGVGAHALPFELRTLPITVTGIYGFYLFDRDGAFGPPSQLLATYMFGVTVHE
jgi:hypothetical protein